MKFNPFYFGTKTIKGAVQLVKRMLPGSPEEIVTPEELAAIKRQSLAERIESGRMSAEEKRFYPVAIPVRQPTSPVALTPSQEGFRRHAEAIATNTAPAPIRALAEDKWSYRRCVKCGKQFETKASSPRVMCNEHAHLAPVVPAR